MERGRERKGASGGRRNENDCHPSSKQMRFPLCATGVKRLCLLAHRVDHLLAGIFPGDHLGQRVLRRILVLEAPVNEPVQSGVSLDVALHAVAAVVLHTPRRLDCHRRAVHPSAGALVPHLNQTPHVRRLGVHVEGDPGTLSWWLVWCFWWCFGRRFGCPHAWCLVRD